jgi:hypothetical protein
MLPLAPGKQLHGGIFSCVTLMLCWNFYTTYMLSLSGI